VGLSVTMVAAVTSTATTTAPVEEGGDKPMVMTPTPGFSDCSVATMAATVGGGRDGRLLERMRLESGSLVSKISWEEEEVTAAATVDTTQDPTQDTTQDTIKDTTKDTTKDPTQDSTQDTTNTLRIATATPATAFSSRGSASVTTR